MDNQFVINQEGNTLTIVLGDQLTTGNAPALMEELNGYKGKGLPVAVYVPLFLPSRNWAETL